MRRLLHSDRQIMKVVNHIQVELGEDAGKRFVIPLAGARVGRSAKNDIVLIDPMLSRHHCRIFFKEDGLWVADLGSANETLLNGEPTIEAPVYRGNRITIGDSVLQIIDDGRDPLASAPSGLPVDLGLANNGASDPRPTKRPGIGTLVTMLCVVVAVAAAAYMMKTLNRPPPPSTTVIIEPDLDMTLTVDYEKVEASNDNIFHYHLTITPEGVLSIAISDLQNNRSVRESKPVEPELLEGLADALKESGFFDLDEAYQGVVPNVLNQTTVSITLGKDTHQVRVINRVEPDVFTVVREKLEDFGHVEIGLWAIQFSTEDLIKMSNDTYLLGKKLYAERLISLGNLAGAIKSLTEAAWYLETVEEKPAFYPDILATRTECEAELKQRYEEQNFRAERAIRLREWEMAASELRVLLELIPDRDNAKHAEARKKLIEVDAQLELLK